MEQIPENSSANTDKATAITESSLGTLLREAREQLGLSVADVANQIKFAPRQIEAIEAGDYEQLPEDAFLRGFIRSYAKILQLDAQKLLEALPNAKGATMELVIPPSVGVPFPNAHILLRQNTILLIAAGVLAAIAGGFALWNFMSPVTVTEVAQVEIPISLPAEDLTKQNAPSVETREPNSTVTNPSKQASKQEILPSESKPQNKPAAQSEVKPEIKTETKPEIKSKPEIKTVDKPEAKPLEMLGLGPMLMPEAKPVTPVTPQQSMPATSEKQPSDATKVTQLRLEFGEESWTEIRDKDDKILSSQVNPAGSELVVSGRAPFTMLIGHGLAARLYYDGKQVDLTPYINKYSEVAHVTLQ